MQPHPLRLARRVHAIRDVLYCLLQLRHLQSGSSRTSRADAEQHMAAVWQCERAAQGASVAPEASKACHQQGAGGQKAPMLHARLHTEKASAQPQLQHIKTRLQLPRIVVVLFDDALLRSTLLGAPAPAVPQSSQA